MRRTRIHVSELPELDGVVNLPDAAAQHLVRVMRMQVGQSVTLFNGDGREHTAEIIRVEKRGVAVRITSPAVVVTNESPLRITLAQGVARGEKMDWIIQKATELGVHAIIPIVSERTEVKLDAERAQRRRVHWQAVVVAACEQSGRVIVPLVAPPVKLSDWLARMDVNAGLRLTLDPKSDLAVRALDIGGGPVTLMVGPEGGLSRNDLDQLQAAQFLGIRLGPRILRTETAGITAIASLQTLFGDLG